MSEDSAEETVIAEEFVSGKITPDVLRRIANARHAFLDKNYGETGKLLAVLAAAMGLDKELVEEGYRIIKDYKPKRWPLTSDDDETMRGLCDLR